MKPIKPVVGMKFENMGSAAHKVVVNSVSSVGASVEYDDIPGHNLTVEVNGRPTEVIPFDRFLSDGTRNILNVEL